MIRILVQHSLLQGISNFHEVTKHQGSCLNAGSATVDLAWGPRVCIFNKFPGNTNAARPQTTL